MYNLVINEVNEFRYPTKLTVCYEKMDSDNTGMTSLVLIEIKKIYIQMRIRFIYRYSAYIYKKVEKS